MDGKANPPDTLNIEHRDHVLILRLDDPSTRNALTNDVLSALAEHITETDSSDDVRAVVISGNDTVFASGSNLRDLASLTPDSPIFAARLAAWDAIRAAATPTVAAVSGYCLGGGCELAMGCDIVVASEDAVFGLPETRLGLLPGAGGTQRLIHAVGKPKAMDMILAGRTLNAAEAETAGLIARVVAPGTALEAAIEIAQEIASRSPRAIGLARGAVLSALEQPLGAGLSVERCAFTEAFGSPDAREGIAAFLEKRTPRWIGDEEPR
jgi:enoyl-CoA hydratase